MESSIVVILRLVSGVSISKFIFGKGGGTAGGFVRMYGVGLDSEGSPKGSLFIQARAAAYVVACEEVNKSKFTFRSWIL
jgi:hypothetical protein